MAKFSGVIFFAALLLLLLLFVRMDILPAHKWQEIRDHQPKNLHLKIVLPKSEYVQGEKIAATVQFSNDDASQPYTVNYGSEDPGATFCAQDWTGHFAPDPLDWYHQWHEGMGGEFVEHVLGSYSLPLNVTSSVRLDHPGRYTLFAESLVRSGTKGDGPSAQEIRIVSDPVPITILPLTPDKEKQIIAEALDKIKKGTPWNNLGREGVDELNALQTSTAREAELPLLDSKSSLKNEAQEGFLGVANPAAEAPRLLAEVQSGHLIFGDEGIWLYSALKTSFMVHDLAMHKLTDPEIRQQYGELSAAETLARQEITAALVAANPHSPAHVETLWIAFRQTAVYHNPWNPDADNGAARKALAPHQLELPKGDVNQLIYSWTYEGWNSADFMPLIQREAKAPNADPRLLIILSGLNSTEARPLVLEQFNQENCPFFSRDKIPSEYYWIGHPMPLPELDSLLRKKFSETCTTAWPILPAINCFGSANLLPDVLGAYRRYGKQWDSHLTIIFFCYWLRSDPPGGREAIEQEFLLSHNRPSPLWEALNQGLIAEDEPLALWMLQQANPELQSNGIAMLQRHGSPQTIDPLLTALERLRSEGNYADLLSTTARSLLSHNRWHFTADQKKRLEALAGLTTK